MKVHMSKIEGTDGVTAIMLEGSYLSHPGPELVIRWLTKITLSSFVVVPVEWAGRFSTSRVDN